MAVELQGPIFKGSEGKMLKTPAQGELALLQVGLKNLGPAASGSLVIKHGSAEGTRFSDKVNIVARQLNDRGETTGPRIELGEWPLTSGGVVGFNLDANESTAYLASAEFTMGKELPTAEWSQGHNPSFLEVVRVESPKPEPSVPQDFTSDFAAAPAAPAPAPVTPVSATPRRPPQPAAPPAQPHGQHYISPRHGGRGLVQGASTRPAPAGPGRPAPTTHYISPRHDGDGSDDEEDE